jgi:hypothetical protein
MCGGFDAYSKIDEGEGRLAIDDASLSFYEMEYGDLPTL